MGVSDFSGPLPESSIQIGDFGQGTKDLAFVEKLEDEMVR
jgi:hypothetical protein